MNIENYIHLFIECQVLCWNEVKGTLKGVQTADEGYNPCQVITEDNTLVYLPYSEVKPMLRPLSSMTGKNWKEEICISCSELPKVYDNFFSQRRDALRVHWLLTNHFDLFNLIPAGLAIDATLHPQTRQP